MKSGRERAGIAFRRHLNLELLEPRQLLATFTVANTNDTGAGSLRQAVTNANSAAGDDVIQFSIGSGAQKITLSSQIQLFGDGAVTIDGWSQPGFTNKPIIEVSGSSSAERAFSVFNNGNTIRGLVINNFTQNAIAIWGGDQNKIQGNYLGTNAQGTAAGDLKPDYDLVYLSDGSTGNVIGIDGNGQSDTLERNLISGGGQSAIALSGSGTSGNRISGNYIGTNAAGATNLGNESGGIRLSSASQNIIGSNNDGVSDGFEGNVIARNQYNGITVIAGTGNRISRNLIHNNGSYQIDLNNDGPTPNDQNDADAGANNLMNFPVLKSLSVGISSLVVGGELRAAPNTIYRVELFATSKDPVYGNGGAQKYLGFRTLTTNGSGSASFTASLPFSLDYGWVVTATATDPSGNTSEFSSSIWQGADVSQAFNLQSRPTATKVIYLDFNGHVTENTLWNSSNNRPTITTPPYSIDGAAAISDEERLRIIGIYQRVMEDFLPFDVNVTTIEPPLADLINSGGADDRWGIRVAIGGTEAEVLGSGSAGGKAYMQSFRWDSDTPALVFSKSTNNGNENDTAAAISHEVGHSLDLSHDGTSSAEYYNGHGSGETSWNTIMGNGYNANVTQWSKGDYLGASNTEDDLFIITNGNGFTYRPDDAGGSTTNAKVLNVIGNKVRQDGIIGRNTDRDVYKFTTTGGLMDVTFHVAQKGPNLDLRVRLLDANGAGVSGSNSATQLGGRVRRTLTAGTYYIWLDGVGTGSPLTQNSGYTDYGSLGFYAIRGTIAGLTNVNPQLSGLGGPLNYVLNSASILLFQAATVSDADGQTFEGGRLKVALQTEQIAENALLIGGLFTSSGNNLIYNGETIGVKKTVVIGATKELIIDFTQFASQTVVQNLLRSIRFRTYNATSTLTRTLNITLTDGDGGTATGTKTILVAS